MQSVQNQQYVSSVMPRPHTAGSRHRDDFSRCRLDGNVGEGPWASEVLHILPKTGNAASDSSEAIAEGKSVEVEQLVYLVTEKLILSSVQRFPTSLLDLPNETLEHICGYLDDEPSTEIRAAALRNMSLVCRRCRRPAQARWKPFRRIRLTLGQPNYSRFLALMPQSQTLWNVLRQSFASHPVRIEITLHPRKPRRIPSVFETTSFAALLSEIAEFHSFALQELAFSTLLGVPLSPLGKIKNLVFLALRGCSFTADPATITLPSLLRLQLNAASLLKLPRMELPALEDLVVYDLNQTATRILSADDLGWLLESTAATLRRLYLHPIQSDALESLLLPWLPSCRNISLIKLLVDEGSIADASTSIIHALPPHIAREEARLIDARQDDTDGESASLRHFFGQDRTRSHPNFRFPSDCVNHAQKIDRSLGYAMRTCL
ncbi:BQ5605_C012g06803 [Microbotryum silenes-dioicae]|uniref:BQ5605_C012g06803 protein n=1 Tax=Microbotryum silenes-dioicae TaxID=796604 RepID=A0A2X0LVR0_9BASI|nr:BQ5605_C012g06803 [Microbotryum silenes-dioicae]